MLDSIVVQLVVLIVIGILGWLAKPLFRRAQEALSRAVEEKPITVEIQNNMVEMSDVPVLFGPTSYSFSEFDPRFSRDRPNQLDDLNSWQSWAYSHGGEDVRVSVVQVTLQGLIGDPISVESPQLDCHDTSAREVQEHFGPDGLGGDGIVPRHFVFQLNGSHVQRTFMEDHDRSEAFQLGAGDTERLLIKVEVMDDLRHEWTLRIPYVRRGKRACLAIKPPNAPMFVTVGAASLEHWWLMGSWWGYGMVMESRVRQCGLPA